MKPLLTPFLLATALLFVPGPVPVRAQEVSPTELKLRDALRNTMLQLRTVESERARLDAELQALRVQTDKEIAGLKLALNEAVKQANEDKVVSSQALKEKTEALAVSEARAAAFATSLDKWKASHVEVAEIARKKEVERATLQAKNLDLNHLVQDRERKNLELFRTGQEILERYESFGLGKAITAREPFTGVAKARLEEQIQDYRHKLKDGFVKAGDPPSSPAPAPTAEVSPAEPDGSSGS